MIDGINPCFSKFEIGLAVAGSPSSETVASSEEGIHQDHTSTTESSVAPGSGQTTPDLVRGPYWLLPGISQMRLAAILISRSYWSETS